MKNLYALTLFLALGQVGFAQTFELSAELRPRFEYRHGFTTLIADNLDATAFVSQRTRLNFDYSSDDIKAYVNLQNIRVWGDVPTLNNSDKNGLAIQQAWAELFFTSQWSVKLGRQEISYDDERIFGSVGWAQQARSHDALLGIFQPNENQRFEIGLALNAEGETLFKSDYDLNAYKNFQYAWYHTQGFHVGLSILVLNAGFAFEDKSKQSIAYNQVFGAHATFSKNKFRANASLYFQTGKIENTSLNANNFAANLYYKISNTTTLGFGSEYLSGTDMNSSKNELKSFNPWFGTNHKFNGWMDYFYVGNHINTVGLIDLNASIAYVKNRFSAKIIPHLFASAATVVNQNDEVMDQTLGTELDLVLNYKWKTAVGFQAGYSQMFATKTMEVLKGGNKDKTNNWAWLMITVKPSLFQTSFKKVD